MKKLLLSMLISIAAPVAAAPELVLQAGHRGNISDLAYSGDGRFLVSASRGFNRDDDFGELKLWNAADGTLIRDFDPSSPALSAINSVSLAPDARLLATANFSNDIALWNVRTGKVQRLLKGHDKGVRAVAFVNGGKRLISAGGFSRPSGELRLWNVATGKLEKILAPAAAEESPILDTTGRESLCLSRDGSRLASRSSRGVTIWDTARWIRLRTFATSEHSSWFGGMAFSPDNRILAMSRESLNGQKELALRSVASGQLLRGIAVDYFVTSLVFTRDGKTLIGGIYGSLGTGPLDWWDVATGRTLRTLETLAPSPNDNPDAVMTGDVGVIAPAPDGRTIAIGTTFSSSIIQQRDAQSGALRATGNAMGTALCDVAALSFSADSRSLAVGQGDGTVRVWTLPANSLATLRGTYDEYGVNHNEVGDVSDVAWTRGDREFVTTGGRNYSMSWWQAGKTRPSVVAHPDYPYGVAISPRGIVAALTRKSSSEKSKIRLWDFDGAKLGEWEIPFNSTGFGVGAIAWTPDGRLAMCDQSFDETAVKNKTRGTFAGRVTLWDTEAKRALSSVDVPDVPSVDAMQFSPDGALMLLHAHINWLYIAQSASGKVLWHAAGQRGAVFSRDGKLVFCRPFGREIEVRDAHSGAIVRRFASFVMARRQDDLGNYQSAWLALSPDGKTLAGKGDDGTVRLWNAADGRLIQSLLIMPTTRNQNHSREWIAWRPDGAFHASPKAAPFLRWRVGDALVTRKPSG